MKGLFLNTLEQLGYPVFLQGSLNSSEEYPDSFFTFWVFQADEESHYNNKPKSCNWGFWIYFYSTDPLLVQNVPLLAKENLKAEGFVFTGKPIDAASDVASHTGSMLTCYIIEDYKGD